MKNIISLGFFCGPAQELEKYGFRSSSFPFDWLISDFKGVNELVQNNFIQFLDESLLLQNEVNRSYYKNKKYNVQFFHDFDRFLPLSEQLENVQNKYKRRIEKFYSTIKAPTIFLRYIEDENELNYINENYFAIESLYKSFNKENEIIYIINDDLSSSIIQHQYKVKKDVNDSVCRKPLDYLPDLVDYLNKEFDNGIRKSNLEYFQSKSIKKQSIAEKMKNKFKKPYRHGYTYK
ncbi:papain-like cysteine peptidase [Macrococcus capreoli]|uniref:papain-like cysteine peptidase n=1 Tax=Macrococcus capreoli TaxID=2982690 RepID=UPI0021D5C289|nr:papain-like cysteine peptidase [Macrococcus sp. TMW 2.2395]MCU7557555.1 papain-like cysteine peptidase [Macrococcus sp. TMW 2.2395]